MCNTNVKIERSELLNGTDDGEAVQEDFSWHAVYTRMHHERKTADRLTRQDIQTYMPVQTIMRQWSDRNKTVEVLVIPTLFFMRIPKNKQLHVLRDPSVSRFLTVSGEKIPAITPGQQMEQFHFMVGRANSPIKIDPDKLVAGDQVRVMKGSLKGLEGTFIKQQGRCMLYIQLDQLGNAGIVISASDVEVK